MAEHRGGCHCGNLRVTLRLTQEPAEMHLRACGCSFCRAHNNAHGERSPRLGWHPRWLLRHPARCASRRRQKIWVNELVTICTSIIAMNRPMPIARMPNQSRRCGSGFAALAAG